jgi:TonB family protein
MLTKVMAAAGLLAAAAQSVQAQTSNVVPGAIQPSGKWAADYGGQSCSIARQFGEGDQQVTMAIRIEPGDINMQIMLLHNKALAPAVDRGPATLTLLPQAKVIKTGYADVAMSGDGYAHALQFSVSLFETGDLPASAAIKFTAGNREVLLQPRGIDAAIKALNVCQDDLLTSMGFEPERIRTIKVPPFPMSDPRTWFTPKDYKDALAGKSGPARLRWTVGTDGRVKACTALVSSGSATFDTLACEAITKRARYSPAMAGDGKPVALPMVQMTY